MLLALSRNDSARRNIAAGRLRVVLTSVACWQHVRTHVDMHVQTQETLVAAQVGCLCGRAAVHVLEHQARQLERVSRFLDRTHLAIQRGLDM